LHDQDYKYDGLHRLKSSNQSGTANDRFWKLDQLGNWDKLFNNTTGTGTAIEERTHNEANELTAFTTPSSTVDPMTDLAGNMTTIPQPKSPGSAYTLTYDAWNRMVEVKEGGTVIQANEFDGLNRRIVRISGGETRHFYYNQQWQVLEERVGTSTTADKQYVYHPHYVDAIAMSRDGNAVEHFYLQDAIANVTAITDNTGTVLERYAYSPYGKVTVLNADFSLDADNKSDIDNEYLYTGRRLDPETGLQLNRWRFYGPHLGRFLTRDPIEYQDYENMYVYVGGRVTIWVDYDGRNGGPIANSPGPAWTPPSGDPGGGGGGGRVCCAAAICCASDGPLPFGDIAAAGLLTGYFCGAFDRKLGFEELEPRIPETDTGSSNPDANVPTSPPEGPPPYVAPPNSGGGIPPNGRIPLP